MREFRESLYAPKMNKGLIIPLLQQYQKHPSLWNPNHVDYKSLKHRTNALKNIKDALKLRDMSVGQLKIRLRNLRSTYVREVNKIVESEKSAKCVYSPCLIWFHVMDSFLRPFVKGCKVQEKATEATSSDQIDNASEDNSHFSFLDHSSDITEKNIKYEYESYYEDESEAGGAEFTSVESPSASNATEEMNPKKKFDEPLNSLSMREDEFDTFGRHIANQLRGMPLADAIRSQNYIQNYLAKERLKFLQGNCSTSTSTNS